MKISVIMAAWNSQKTIATALKSFLEQDHADKELIVIDGASKDNTCQIVRSFDSSLIKLQSEPDKGIYDALNKGILQARGDVIGVLHSNDHFARRTILSDVAAAFAVPNLDVVYADVSFFTQEAPDLTIRRYRSAGFAPSKLSRGIMPAHPSMFMHRRVFNTYGLYKTDYRIAGDFEYVARIFKDSKLQCRYIESVWTYMLAGGASTSGIKSKIILNKEIMRACQELGISTNWFKILSRYPGKLLELLPHGKIDQS